MKYIDHGNYWKATPEDLVDIAFLKNAYPHLMPCESVCFLKTEEKEHGRLHTAFLFSQEYDAVTANRQRKEKPT